MLLLLINKLYLIFKKIVLFIMENQLPKIGDFSSIIFGLFQIGMLCRFLKKNSSAWKMYKMS